MHIDARNDPASNFAKPIAIFDVVRTKLNGVDNNKFSLILVIVCINDCELVV